MRLYVKLSPEMGEKLDKYATEFGQTKSGFIGFAVASYIRQLEKQDSVYKTANDVIVKASQQEQQEGDSAYETDMYY